MDVYSHHHTCGHPVNATEGGLSAQEKLGAVKALEEIHAAGVLHGDIKAENILVQRHPNATMPSKVRLIDFAFAKFNNEEADVFFVFFNRVIYPLLSYD
jgi:serine/threonine protein kinase